MGKLFLLLVGLVLLELTVMIEVGSVIGALPTVGLLVLTAVRPGELRAAPWAEFDLDAATWTIPKERMKARRDHQVPLPRQAVDLSAAQMSGARGDIDVPARRAP